MTNCEIASKYNISSRPIGKWKNQIKHKIAGDSFSNSKVYSKIKFMKNKCKNDDSVITLSKDDFNAIKEYICYYNNRRIQIGLGGLTPSEYRLKFKTT